MMKQAQEEKQRKDKMQFDLLSASILLLETILQDPKNRFIASYPAGHENCRKQREKVENMLQRRHEYSIKASEPELLSVNRYGSVETWAELRRVALYLKRLLDNCNTTDEKLLYILEKQLSIIHQIRNDWESYKISQISELGHELRSKRSEVTSCKNQINSLTHSNKLVYYPESGYPANKHCEKPWYTLGISWAVLTVVHHAKHVGDPEISGEYYSHTITRNEVDKLEIQLASRLNTNIAANVKIQVQEKDSPDTHVALIKMKARIEDLQSEIKKLEEKKRLLQSARDSAELQKILVEREASEDFRAVEEAKRAFRQRVRTTVFDADHKELVAQPSSAAKGLYSMLKTLKERNAVPQFIKTEKMWADFESFYGTYENKLALDQKKRDTPVYQSYTNNDRSRQAPTQSEPIKVDTFEGDIIDDNPDWGKIILNVVGKYVQGNPLTVLVPLGCFLVSWGCANNVRIAIGTLCISLGTIFALRTLCIDALKRLDTEVSEVKMMLRDATSVLSLLAKDMDDQTRSSIDGIIQRFEEYRNRPERKKGSMESVLDVTARFGGIFTRAALVSSK